MPVRLARPATVPEETRIGTPPNVPGPARRYGPGSERSGPDDVLATAVEDRLQVGHLRAGEVGQAGAGAEEDNPVQLRGAAEGTCGGGGGRGTPVQPGRRTGRGLERSADAAVHARVTRRRGGPAAGVGPARNRARNGPAASWEALCLLPPTTPPERASAGGRERFGGSRHRAGAGPAGGGRPAGRERAGRTRRPGPGKAPAHRAAAQAPPGTSPARPIPRRATGEVRPAGGLQVPPAGVRADRGPPTARGSSLCCPRCGSVRPPDALGPGPARSPRTRPTRPAPTAPACANSTPRQSPWRGGIRSPAAGGAAGAAAPHTTAPIPTGSGTPPSA
ncbi:hypothetical protein SUDANB6_05730 [Streptomyces sp. enrichment culture]